MALSIFMAFFLLVRDSQEPPRVYSVTIWDRPAGLQVKRSLRVEEGGRRFAVHSTRTVLLDRSVRTETYWVDEAEDRVTRCSLELRQGDDEEVTEAVFERGRAKIAVRGNGGATQEREITLEPGVLVPWDEAVPVLAGEASLKVFRIADGLVHSATVEFEAEECLVFHGQTYDCRRWSLLEDGRRMLLWIDAAGALVRKEIPAEGFVLTPADPETAKKMIRRDRWKPPYFRVEERIPDRAALTYLEVRAVLELEDLSGLRSAEQIFEGDLDAGKVDGVFKVRARRLKPEEALGLAPGQAATVESAPYLSPGPGIECEDPVILERAKVITEKQTGPLASVAAIGAWIKEAIVLDADGGETALDSLGTGRADALGMARLHAALCRAVGIPCRPVRGLIYVDSGEEGGFLGHYWNEVLLGKAGWIPVDVSAGEADYLDAGHIRLGGEGPFRIVKMKIIDYLPKAEKVCPAPPPQPRPFPLVEGETNLFDYFEDGVLIGTEKVVFQGMQKGGEAPLFRFHSRLDLKGIGSESDTVTTVEGKLVSHRVVRGEDYRFYEAMGDVVYCEIARDSKVEKERVALSPEGLFFDNQQVLLLGLMLSRLEIKAGDKVRLGLFHLSTRKNIVVTVENKGVQKEKIRGGEELLNIFEVRDGFQLLTLYMTGSGLPVREIEQGGRVRVEWRGKE